MGAFDGFKVQGDQSRRHVALRFSGVTMEFLLMHGGTSNTLFGWQF